MTKWHTKDKLRIDQEQDTEMIDETEPTGKDTRDFIKSQSVLGDFLGFLDDLAKQRQRTMNSMLFSQISTQIVDLITV